MPLTKDDLAKLSFKLEKFNTETNKWEVYGNYGNIPYSKLKPLEETPGDDTPGGDTPGDDTPGGDTPGGDTPAEEEQYDIFTQTILKNLGLGTYRITESGNSDIKQNHAGSEAYVKYVWEDNTDGTTESVEFEITMNHLDKAQNRTITFTNNYTTDTVDRKAAKKWYDVNGSEINWPKGLKVKFEVVTYDDGVFGSTAVKSVELDGVADDKGEFVAGTASFNGLRKYKDDGETLQQYALREATEFKGYTSDNDYYLLENSKAVTVKNTKTATSVSVTKHWMGGTPANASATICLWGYPENGTVADAKALSTLVVKASENCTVDQNGDWLITFENVPVTSDADVPLNYFFTEIGCSPGYEPSYPSDGTFAGEGGIITNAIAKTSFKMTKQWRNTTDNLWPAGKLIQLTLGRKKAGSNTEDSFSLSCTLTDTKCTPAGTLPKGTAINFTDKGDGKYCLEVTGLDKYASDGKLWQYFVTEGELEGFTALYEDESHSVVNQSAPNGGYIFNSAKVYSLTVSKEVTGNFGDQHYYFTYTIEMKEEGKTPFAGTLHYQKTGAWSGDVDDNLTFVNGSATFTLCHNESITFEAVPATMTYSVTEERSGARGYTVQSSANGTPSKASDSQYLWYGPICDNNGKALDDQRISYVNDRSRLIPTGVEMQIGSSVALFLLFTLVLAFMMMRKRSESDSE